MDRLTYTSLSALRSAMARQTTTANNLANANTTGFKAEIAGVRPLWLEGQGFTSRVQASEEVLTADTAAGAVSQTGRGLDVAVNGDAMLAVQTPEGEEAYTRRGDLQVSDTGLLTTGDGYPVLGDQGPITVPPSDSMRIDEDGTLWIVPTGGDPNQPQQVDRLKLASPTGSQIAKGADGLFRVVGGGALPADPQAKVINGSLEGSNVNQTKALVDMIDASRAWDMQLKLITSARDLDSASADLMRIPD